ncbi:hypothetical protein PIB30_093095 [Stylosanthes scabra]|uniref:Uncharacterized protein n=1 Tax=Stylosanthes scabra TaxID=79078 RepID=A0ABU6WY94_9FABA|nr:hypothetical protein [Stylosanthes scabra]
MFTNHQHTYIFHRQLDTGAPIAIPSVATRCSRRPRHVHTNCEGARKWRIAPIECRLWHSQGIQARSWVSVGEFWRIVVGFKCLQESSLLSFTSFIEPISILRVTLRESKRHVGAYEANDLAYDNSGLSEVVDEWGVFGLTSRFTGRYIRNIKERNPHIYMIKRKTVNGWGIERVVLGEVRPIVVRD